jgi:hypothetical protein
MSASFPYFGLARERGLDYAKVLAVVDSVENSMFRTSCGAYYPSCLAIQNGFKVADVDAIADAVSNEHARRREVWK